LAETLPRTRVIRRRADFDLVRNRGRRHNNRYLTLSVLPLNRDDTASVAHAAHVAFLVPKRLGPATVRNRLRRRMREIYRRHLQPATPTHYLVWIARPPAVQLDFAALKGAMELLFSKKD